MKYTYLLLLLSLVTKNIAQSPIINVQNWNGQAPPNSYVKDVNNVFDPFVGTWLYTSPSMTLKIVLIKKVMVFNTIYYEDFLIGEYELIQDGIQIISTLSQLQNQTNPFLHKIIGNYIPTTPTPFPAGTDAELRIDLAMFENVACSVNFRKTTINNSPVLQMFKSSTPSSAREGQIQRHPFIKDGWYNLYKQP